MDETERRRTKQMAFNAERGITPRGVMKRIRDLIDGVVDPRVSEAIRDDQGGSLAAERSAQDLSKELVRIEKAMLEHARNLEFEKAAQLRDQLTKLKEEVFGVDKPRDSIEKALV